MTAKDLTTSVTIHVGDIFEHSGDFMQVVKVTKKTVVVRPIECEFVGNADSYGWMRQYMPKPDVFADSDPWLTREECAKGKRLKVIDFSQAKNNPCIKFNHEYFHLWDGTPSVFDSYN